MMRSGFRMKLDLIMVYIKKRGFSVKHTARGGLDELVCVDKDWELSV